MPNIAFRLFEARRFAVDCVSCEDEVRINLREPDSYYHDERLYVEFVREQRAWIDAVLHDDGILDAEVLRWIRKGTEGKWPKRELAVLASHGVDTFHELARKSLLRLRDGIPFYKVGTDVGDFRWAVRRCVDSVRKLLADDQGGFDLGHAIDQEYVDAIAAMREAGERLHFIRVHYSGAGIPCDWPTWPEVKYEETVEVPLTVGMAAILVTCWRWQHDPYPLLGTLFCGSVTPKFESSSTALVKAVLLGDPRWGIPDGESFDCELTNLFNCRLVQAAKFREFLEPGTQWKLDDGRVLSVAELRISSQAAATRGGRSRREREQSHAKLQAFVGVQLKVDDVVVVREGDDSEIPSLSLPAEVEAGVESMIRTGVLAETLAGRIGAPGLPLATTMRRPITREDIAKLIGVRSVDTVLRLETVGDYPPPINPGRKPLLWNLEAVRPIILRERAIDIKEREYLVIDQRKIAARSPQKKKKSQLG